MKKLLSIILVLSLVLCLISCGNITTKINNQTTTHNSQTTKALPSTTKVPSTVKTTVETKPALIKLNGEVDLNQGPSTQVEDEFKSSIQDFSTSMALNFLEAFENGNNISLSPLSIFTCLAMSTECAKEETREEILNALGVSYEDLVSNIRDLLVRNNIIEHESFEKDKVTFEERLINSIWLENTGEYKEEALKNLHDNYLCEAYGVDFKHNTQEVVRLLNKYIKEKTNNLIDIELDLTKDTLAVLLNVLYIRDSWADYDLSFTDELYKFTNYNNETVEINLLKSHYFNGRVLELENSKIFSIYTQAGIELMFIVPKNGLTVKEALNKDFAQAIKAKYKDSDETGKYKYKTRVLFPSFETDSEVEIQNILREKYNINQLFSFSCDFGNLTDQEVHVDAVVHATKVKVNEKGVEGAAITAMIVKANSSFDDTEYKFEDFIIDRSFGFMILKDRIPLFSGIVNEIGK